MKQVIVGKIYSAGPWSSAGKIVFNSKDYGVIAVRSNKEEQMLDLYKEFMDWLAYNYPGTKLESLQEDLTKIALRNYSVKTPKVASKAILRELAKLIVTGN